MTDYGWGFGAAVMAGLLNATAGSGNLVAFFALSAAGVPPLQAHVTTMISTPASFALSWRQPQQTTTRSSGGAALFVAAAAGTVAGALLLANTDPAWFRGAAPWGVLVAAVLLAGQPWIPARWQSGPRRRSTLLAGAGVYAGSIGAGTSTLVLFALGNIDLQLKNKVCLVTSVVGTVTLAVAGYFTPGLVNWVWCGVLAAGMFGGGAIGSIVVSRLSDRTGTATRIRGAVVVVSLAGAAWMLAPTPRAGVPVAVGAAALAAAILLTAGHLHRRSSTPIPGGRHRLGRRAALPPDNPEPAVTT